MINKYFFLGFYKLLSWLILLVLILSVFLFFLLNSPAIFLNVLRPTLADYNVSYGKMHGSLLTGFSLEDANYNNQVWAEELSLKIDFEALENRVLKIDYLKANGLKVEKKFLATLLDTNSSTEEQNSSKTTLPFDKVFIDNAEISFFDIGYESYSIRSSKLTLNRFETDMKKNHKGKLVFFLDSNVSKIDLKGKLLGDKYDFLVKVEGERLFIQPVLEDTNISLKSNPKLDISVSGDFDKVNYILMVKRLDLAQGEYLLKSEKLVAKGSYDIQKNSLENTLETVLNLNVAKIKLNARTSLDLDDINKSLNFDLALNIDAKKELLSSLKLDSNLSLIKIPHLMFNAKGDMDEVKFKSNFKELAITYNDISLKVKSFDLKGKIKPLSGKTDVELTTLFHSNVANGDIDVKSSFNFNEIEKDLLLESRVDATIMKHYLNPLLKEQGIVLEDDVFVKLSAKGNSKVLDLKASVKSEVESQGIASLLLLKTENIKLNLEKHRIAGALTLDSSSKNLDLSLKSEFLGDYLKVKEMRTSTRIIVSNFNAFGINLSSLTPLNLKVDTASESLNLLLKGQDIQLKAKSSDFDHIEFKIESNEIYPHKIVALPNELVKKFIKVNLEGQTRLSTEYFTLKGVLESNKAFKLNVHAKNNENGLEAKLFSKELSVLAKGSLEEKELEVSIEIRSLKKLQKELSRLYAFKALKVDGALKLVSKLRDEKVEVTLSSPKLKLDGFNVEKVEIEAQYAEQTVLLDKLSFNITGFKKKSLNQKYYLKKQGLVQLGAQKKILLNIHPNILIKGQGNAHDMTLSTQIEALPLGHDKYGHMLLSCDVDYQQVGLERRITGAVFLDKMKLFYESKFLDPSSDADVIIVDKNKKDSAEDDSFLKHTFIDLNIYSKDAKYKTKDLNLDFTVQVKAKKEFAKPLGLLGKVKEIDGRVEQAPKLFTVVDSNIVFTGAKEINPLLDLKVEHALPDVLIRIRIHGTAKYPKLEFSSEPPLPKKDILSYLLLGVSTSALGSGEGSYGREAQLFIMNQAARDFAYDLELDRVFVKDDGTGEGYAFQVGKNIQEGTMLVIESSKEGNSLMLEYDVSKNIKVEIGHHQKTIPSQSIDLYYRKKFK
jgi:hypothetical protein